MRKAARLIALILALVLLLQCVAAASPVPEEEEYADAQTFLQALAPSESPEDEEITDSPANEQPETSPENSDPTESTEPEEPSEPDDPSEPGDPSEPDDSTASEQITITASLKDGQLVHNPKQELTVRASENETALLAEAINVSLNGKTQKVKKGAYSLTLAQGDNIIEITAKGSSGSKTITITVRFEILIPNGWAHDALEFCVDYGILNGNAFGDLLPADHASRAQLAAMLVRLFDAKPTADLNGYTDVEENAWYYSEMSRAVAMGIFEGSGGKLMPQQPLTREQAFTVLARAFGVAAGSLEALEAFPDGERVSNWAANSVAGMLEAGYIHGTSSGTINPKGNITRQELAQVLFNALDCITDDPEAIDGSRVLYTGPIDALAGKTVSGSLILSCESGEDVVLPEFTVEGRLVLQLHNAKTVKMGPISDTIAVCCPAFVTIEGQVDTIFVLRDRATLRAEARQAITLGNVTLHNKYENVYCQSGNPVIASSAHIQNMHFAKSAAGSKVSVYGEVENLYAEANRLKISEFGRVETLYQYCMDLDVSCTVGTVVDRIDAGLTGVSVISNDTPSAYYDKLDLVVSGTITGVNNEKIYGVPDGVRKCTVTYSYNGKTLKTEKDFLLTEGAKLSCPVTAALRYNIEEIQNVVVTIRYGSETMTANLPFLSTGRYSDYYLAKNTVRTIHVIAVVNYSTSIYSSSSLSGYLTSVPAGANVYFLKYVNDSGSIALVETKDGVRGYISGYAIRISWQNYHNNDVSYSDGVKEVFVNEIKNYSSKTKYLIWCNLYTTTVNIFEGSQGNWKLIKSCECVIGAPNSPTRPGVYSIYSHAYYWSFDEGSRLDVSRCYYASLFDGGIAFHTRLYYTGTNNMVNPTLSDAISHGCVRCPDDIAKFIYNECPNGTTVVVY